MALILYKWLLAFFLTGNFHPVYISVSEVEFNRETKTVDISCKLFTDDFEQTLRMSNTGKIDLLNLNRKSDMLPLVKNYILSHFRIMVNGKDIPLEFLDFEKDDDGVVSFIQGKFSGEPVQVRISNNLLYEYKDEQMGIIHVFVRGKRKSTRLLNPESVAELRF
jgi:hypothetical protein